MNLDSTMLDIMQLPESYRLVSHFFKPSIAQFRVCMGDEKSITVYKLT